MRHGLSRRVNSAANPLLAARNSAAGQYVPTLSKALIRDDFMVPRWSLSRPIFIFPLLAAERDGIKCHPRPRCRTLLGVLLLGFAVCGAANGQSVLTYHGNASRSGNFIVPALTWERARTIHLDPSFHPRIAGHLYAQPLYWRPRGATTGQLLVATEDDNVYAIDAGSGREIWVRSLGRPVPLSTLPCSNIDPLGITGTPVIDEATQAIYADAMIADPAGPHHRVFALSLKDGSLLPGWPVDVADALAARGDRFVARDQNQRGALAILDDRVYIPYGGHYGDCEEYRGWVVGISLHNPRDVVGWSTRGLGGGIWAPGGIASDGRSLFVATGNTIGVETWSDGEAVFRLAPDLRRREQPQDFCYSNRLARARLARCRSRRDQPPPVGCAFRPRCPAACLSARQGRPGLSPRSQPPRRDRRQPRVRGCRVAPDPYGAGSLSRR